MTMTEWAKKEVELYKEKQDDYGKLCADSALKAFLSLMDDGHSGFSIKITQKLLNRLINGQPLQPIEDKDFVQDPSMPQDSEEYLKENNLKSEIQCPRMPSLFRCEHLDGKIEYHDNYRAYCFDIDNPHITYTSHLCKIIDELYPITMPYYPSVNKYKIAIEDRLHDKSLGDYDLIRIAYIIKPNSEKEIINRCYQEVITGYFKYKDSDDIRHETKMIEIDYETYKKLANEQIKSHYNPEVDELKIIEPNENHSNNCECCG